MTRPVPAGRATPAALACLAAGVALSVVGAAVDREGFFRAWLAAYLFWLGVPLAGVTLVLVHDLTGGRWMATARPILDAAILTMPLATLAGIPAFIGLGSLYRWTHPAPDLSNVFYLNDWAFLARYAIDIVLWNLLALYALLGPRGAAQPVAPGWSWLSGIGLVLLAVSAGFAAIDWILSLEPTFWSSIFPMIAGAGWFNTGMALVALLAAAALPAGERVDHLADLAAILLATTIFWAYVEFCQFLIIWEENLRSEIPWYLTRMRGAWRPAIFVAVGLGFLIPFFTLLLRPAKRSAWTVAIVALLILVARLADIWWLVLPEYHPAPPFWLDAGTVLALGGLVALLFLRGLAAPLRRRDAGAPAWKAFHG